MATIGPLFCGTGASFNDGGTTAWTNPTNIQGDTTATAATCNVGSNGGTSHKLRASNFGFTGLGGATINGVTVEIERNAANANRHYENNIQLLKGGTETGNNKSDGSAIPTGKAFKTYGGAADGWGASLVGGDVTATGFGVSFKILRSAAQTTTTSVYRVRITVDYTSASFSADAIIRKAIAPTGPAADAVRKATITPPSLPTADAIVLGTQSGSFVASAFLLGWFHGDAIRRRNSGTLGFGSDAVIWRTQTPVGFPSEAIRKDTISPVVLPTIDATRKASFAGTPFDASAIRVETFSPSGWPADAIRIATVETSFLIGDPSNPDGAQISAGMVTVEDSFPAEAIRKASFTGTPFDSEAIRLKTAGSTFTAAASKAGAISLEAWIGATVITGFFRANSVLGYAVPQYARPASDITQTHFTNGYEQINDETAPDADYAFGADNKVAILEVGLSSVADPLTASGHVIRYRIAKVYSGNVDGAGNAVTVTMSLYQGSTLIATDAARTATGTWTEYSYTLSSAEADAITDYSSLRLRFTTTASGGTPTERRGGAISLAVLEVPAVEGDTPSTVINSLLVNAFIRGWLRADAIVRRKPTPDPFYYADARLAGHFTIDAWRPITARAWIAGRFTVDAFVGWRFTADAIKHKPAYGSGSFTADAKRSGIFTADARFSGIFRADAFKVGAGTNILQLTADAFLAGGGVGGVGGRVTVTAAYTEYEGASGTQVNALPNGIAAGDLLLVYHVRDGSASVSWPSGWTSVIDSNTGGGSAYNSIRYRIVADTDSFTGSGDTVTITAGGGEGATHAYLIKGWHGSSTPEAAFTTGSGYNPDPPNLSPTWGLDNNAWFSGFGMDQDWAVSVYPLPQLQRRDGTGGVFGVTIATCAQLLDRVASKNPGTFTQSHVSIPWLVWTMAVRPAASFFSTFAIRAQIADKARVSQSVVEAVVLPDTQKARVSQAVVEAVVMPDTQMARVSQSVIEAVVLPVAPARLSQLVAEIVAGAPQPTVQVSQVVAEVILEPIPPPVALSQLVVEVLHSRGFYKTFTINAEIKRIFKIDAFIKPWFEIGWAWQSPPGTMRATHVLDAWVKGRITGSLAIAAFVKPWFTVDARKCGGGSFTIDAKLQWFPADAIRKRTQYGGPCTGYSDWGLNSNGAVWTDGGGTYPRAWGTPDRAGDGLSGSFATLDASMQAPYQTYIRYLHCDLGASNKAVSYLEIGWTFHEAYVYLESSTDNVSWIERGGPIAGSSGPNTLSIPSTNARYWRLRAEVYASGTGYIGQTSWRSVSLYGCSYTPYSITVDARKELGFFANASIRWVPAIRSFSIYARIAGGGSFTVDARKSPRFAADAVIHRPQPVVQPTFTADGWKTGVGRNQRFLLADAFVKKGKTASFTAGWYTVAAVVPGSFVMDCWVAGIVTGTATIDALISEVTRYRDFVAQWDIASAGERRFLSTIDATVSWLVRRTFTINAQIPEATTGRWLVDARIAPYLKADATIWASSQGVIWINARKSGGGTISANAFVARHFRANAVKAAVFVPGTRTYPLYMLALIVRSISAEAWISPHGGFSADAFVSGYLRIDAFIRGNQIIVFPPGGGSPTDPWGGPPPVNRRFRVAIWISQRDWWETSDPSDLPGHAWAQPMTWSEITPDVVWAETDFTQEAKVSPGTFRITLRGAFNYVGGEEVRLEIDEFRQFAGTVSRVEKTYFFSDDPMHPKTILYGTDYNAVLDRRMVYSRDWEVEQVASTGLYYGPYRPPAPWPKGIKDRALIIDIFDRLVQPFGTYYEVRGADPEAIYSTPPKWVSLGETPLDYETYVDEISTPAPAGPWAVESGMSLRQVLSSITRITKGIFWIDPFWNLHYHSRSAISAPKMPDGTPMSITDGDGGISCRNLVIETDMSMMVNDVLVFGQSGTGTPVGSEKNKVVPRHNSVTASVEKYGRRQYAEFREDLIGYDHIHMRSASILDRYAYPITRAQATIWEPGFQAGMVVHVSSSAYNAASDLVIRQIKITFATSKGPDGTTYYGIPQFDLVMGLDPEEPWNIYDFLPYGDTAGIASVADTSGGGNVYGLSSGGPAWELGRRYFWNQMSGGSTLDLPDWYNWSRHSTATGRSQVSTTILNPILDWQWVPGSYNNLTDASNIIDGNFDSRSVTWNAGAAWSFQCVGEYTIVLPQPVLITRIGVRCGGFHAHEDSGCIICNGDRKRHPRLLLNGTVLYDSRLEGPEMEYGKSEFPAVWWWYLGGIEASTVSLDFEYYSAGLNYLGEQSVYEVVIFGDPTIPVAGPAFSEVMSLTTDLTRDLDNDLAYQKTVSWWQAGYWDFDEGIIGTTRVSQAAPSGTSLLATDHNDGTNILFRAWVQGVGFGMAFAQIDLGASYFVRFMHLAMNQRNLVLWGSEDGNVWYPVRAGFEIDSALHSQFTYHWDTTSVFGMSGVGDYVTYTFPVMASARYWRLGMTGGTFCGGLTYVGATYLRSWEIYGTATVKAGLGWGCQRVDVDDDGNFELVTDPVQTTLQVYDLDGRMLLENRQYERVGNSWRNYRLIGRTDLHNNSITACYLNVAPSLRSQVRGIGRGTTQDLPTDRVRVNDIRGF